jgi:hypothetical protein
MDRDEIQTGNPGGVHNRPAPRIAGCSPDEGAYDRLHGDAFVRRRINVAASLSCVWGTFAVGLVVVGFLVQHYEPHWLEPLWIHLRAAGWFGSLLGLPVFCLGVAGARTKTVDVVGGFLWACLGMLLGLSAMFGAVVLFFEPMSRISGC